MVAETQAEADPRGTANAADGAGATKKASTERGCSATAETRLGVAGRAADGSDATETASIERSYHTRAVDRRGGRLSSELVPRA